MAPPSTTTQLEAHRAAALRPSEAAELHDRLVEYYQASSLDYRFWSRGYQMHFGYFRAGQNPFAREDMLEEMTRQVLTRLGLSDAPARVIDLGCGLGAPARNAVHWHRAWQLDAISLVPWQIEYAAKLSRDCGDGRLRFHVADYTQSPFGDGEFDAAYAIESSCHAAGADKRDFIREAARILKPGATLVVADGFIEREPLPWPLAKLMRVLCHNWAVPRFANRGQFLSALRESGFEVTEVSDVSFRVAPSALHVPWVTLRFVFASLFQKVSRLRWGHVLASVLSPLVGMARPYFRYYLIAARRQSPAAGPEAPAHRPHPRVEVPGTASTQHQP